MGKRGKQINPIRKSLLKQNLLAGKSIRQSLRNAGYTESTAARSSGNSSVKIITNEIEQDIKKKITVDYVLTELERVKKLAEEAGDFSTATRNNELIGKFLAMFTERQIRDDTIRVSAEEKSVLDRYVPNRIVNLIVDGTETVDVGAKSQVDII